MTVLELITSSLRLIGQLKPGRQPSLNQCNDALLALNGMLDSWKNDRLMVYAIDREEFSLQPSQASYTIGRDGADWTADRPVKIENAGLMIDSETEVPITVLTSDQWANIREKDLTSTEPTRLWYAPTVPNGRVYCWPIPTESQTIALYLWTTVSTFASLSQTITLPPGYADAIRYNLAVRMAPEWGMAIRPDVAALAVESLSKLKTVNAPDYEVVVDRALVGPGRYAFDWRTGE